MNGQNNESVRHGPHEASGTQKHGTQKHLKVLPCGVPAFYRRCIEPLDDDPPFEDVDPEKLAECRYWRCGELFERRSANNVFCRKACRSRQRKWERSVERKNARKANR